MPNGALHLAKGILLGGVLAIVALFSGILTIVLVTDHANHSVVEIVGSLLVFVTSLLGAIWATGFWGRWGMVLFFAVAPAVIAVEFQLNPLFPVGTILFGALCYRLAGKARDGASRSARTDGET